MDLRLTEGRPKPKNANHSPLMQALQKASLGEKVNVCPYGCTEEDLDDRGLCDHLVGYTTDGKTMEPLVAVRGRKTVQVPDGPDGKPRRVPIPAGAHLERITTSARVYHRGNDKQPKGNQ